MNRSIRAVSVAAVFAAALGAPTLLRAADAVRKIALVTIPAELQLQASPDRVWSVLTTRDGFSTLTGTRITGDLSGFSAVGDHVAATVNGDSGHLFVTYFQPGSELRVNFEPDSGAYFSQQRVRLSTWSGGTTLSLTDRYTDEKSNADQTARRVTDQLLDGTKAFQKMVQQP